MQEHARYDGSKISEVDRLAKRFIGRVLAFSMVALLSIGSTLWLLDPMNFLIMGDTDRARQDARALSGIWWGLLTKVALERQVPFDAILVGSSKIMNVDPADLRYYRFLNAGSGGAMIEYIHEFLDLSAHNVELVVLGLDFLMLNNARNHDATDAELAAFRSEADAILNPRGDPRNRARSIYESVTRNFSYLLSMKAVERIVSDYRKATCAGDGPLLTLLASGNMNTRDWVRATELDRTKGIEVNQAQYKRQLETARTQQYAPFVYSTRRIDVLRDIKSMLEARGIRLIVLINPINVKDLELIRSMGLENQLNRYRADIKAVFPASHDFSESIYSEPSYYFNWDPIHFLPATGAKIINNLLDEVATPNRRSIQASQDAVNQTLLKPPIKAPIASGIIGTYIPQHAYDGDEETFWLSPEKGAAIKGHSWIGAVFDQPQKIRKIRLTQLGNPPYDQDMVLVQQSIDGGKTWINIGPGPFCSYDVASEINLPDTPPATHWRIMASADNATGRNDRWSVMELVMLSR